MNALTLDLGNSALKLARWNSDAPSFLSVGWEDDWAGALRAELQTGGTPSTLRVAVASVVQVERCAQVLQVCGDQHAGLWVNPEAPLELDCRETHTIGRDRLYAAAGAWMADPRPAIVVDAGTALTVDALGAGEGCGRFMGGAIAPGPALLAGALARGGAQLFEVQIEGHVPALGRDTLAALRSGVGVGFRGAAAELVRCVSEEAGLEGATVWLTGGARHLLTGPGLFGKREVREDPWLVHRGLLASIASLT